MESESDILYQFFPRRTMGNDYINNAIFEETIARFQLAKKNKEENITEYKIAQDDLAKLFYLLAENIIRAFKFQLIDRDDALQEGVMICFEKLDRFNPEIGRAFNYYTTCTLNHYRQLYRTAKNHNELKKRYHDHLVSKLEDVFMNALNGKTKFRKKPTEEI